MDVDEPDGIEGEERHEGQGDVAHRNERCEEDRETDALGEYDPVGSGEGVYPHCRERGAAGPGIDVVRRQVCTVLGKHMDAQVAQGLCRDEVVGRVSGNQSALGAKQKPGEDLTDDDCDDGKSESQPTSGNEAVVGGIEIRTLCRGGHDRAVCADAGSARSVVIAAT